ncbi:MAG TPA: hypothetical protein VNS31_11165 [Ramlibacter sp.]|nr:hypothetical protein [Ramlibacter sp.]
MNQPKGSSASPPRPQAPARKRAYRSPELREYGSVPILTQSISKSGSVKDGGPNNIKT